MTEYERDREQGADEDALEYERIPDGGEPSSIQERVADAIEWFEADRTLRTLLESLAEGLIIVDQDGTLLLVNRRAEEMFGYDRDEMVGRPLSGLLPEGLAETHDQYVADYFQNPRIRSMAQGLELVARRKDDSQFPVDIGLSFLDTEAGLLGLALVTDITRRKQAELALKQRNEELDAFAHMVAHELTSSSSLIVGYSQVLLEQLETTSPGELQKVLEIMAAAGHKLNSIVNELLLFARLPKGDVEATRLDMAEIVDQALARLKVMIEQYQAEVVLPADYPEALGYAPWVEEVWYNFISNAVKYGGRPPRVELGGRAREDGHVEFWVKDNGAGLTAEQQARLAGAAAPLEHPQIKGHGLGLSIVRRILEKLDGQMVVESEVGQGSVFSFTLPGTDGP
jgi:PAS domain S-box-containing protein